MAECLELAVITQGRTLDETVSNLRDAIALHLEGEDRATTIPQRKDLAPGTLHAIYGQALKFVAAEQLRRHFFHE